MPELPEVETVRRSLLGPLLGQRIQTVTVGRKDIIRGCRDRVSLLGHCRVQRIERRGKQLALISEPLPRGDQPTVCVHLGMSGSLRFYPHTAPPARHDRHTHVRWRLAAGTMVFRDPRRFGGVWTFSSPTQLCQARWQTLGEDALTITPAPLHRKLARTGRATKAALLDQHVIAGLGNIYVDESLFAAGIHPLTPASALDRAQVQQLVRAIRRILARALAAGGSTLRDYVSGDGDPGRFQFDHRVYGRASQPCWRCRANLNLIRVAGRSSVFCPRCQPAR